MVVAMVGEARQHKRPRRPPIALFLSILLAQGRGTHLLDMMQVQVHLMVGPFGV